MTESIPPTENQQIIEQLKAQNKLLAKINDKLAFFVLLAILSLIVSFLF